MQRVSDANGQKVCISCHILTSIQDISISDPFSFSKTSSFISVLLLVSCCCQFCRLLVSTVERCQMALLERLEANAKLKRQNFGSQSYSPPKSSVSSSAAAASQAAATLPQPPETPRTDSDTTLKKGKTCDIQEESNIQQSQ